MRSNGRIVLISPPSTPIPPTVRTLTLTRFESGREFLESGNDSGGVVLLHPALGGADILELLVGLLKLEGPWAPIPLAGSGGGEVLWPLSLGYPLPPSSLDRDEANGEAAEILQLRTVLTELRTARHDMNNPLTSALAETQLLLIDAEEGEDREALLQIQTQLRKIRDMVEDLGRLRPPDA